jgi:DNA-binding MurR/RpiR family transcriptional regulator
VEKIDTARRIIILAESLAETAAYLLLQILEEGGYPAYSVQHGITDIARALYSLNSDDLLIAIEIKGETPFVTRALATAQKNGVTTGAIVSAPSLPSANHADFVLTLQSKTSEGLGIVMVDAMIYALSQALRWKEPERYRKAQRSISRFSKQIQGKD